MVATQKAPVAHSVAEEKKMLLVRIHPLDAKHTKQTYLVHGLGLKFDVAEGWIEVPERLARHLAKIRNNPDDNTSPRVFQLVTHEGARALDEAAKRKAAEATAPNRLSSTFSKAAKAAQRPIPLTKDELEGLTVGPDDEQDDFAEEGVNEIDPNEAAEDFADALEDARPPRPAKRDLTTEDLRDGTTARAQRPEIPEDALEDALASAPKKEKAGASPKPKKTT